MPDIKNCHFPGLYSIILDEAPGPLYRRVYVLPPGEGHPDLRIRNSGFLIHDHRYDFVSRTLCGTVINRIFREFPPTQKAEGIERLHEFSVESGILGEFAIRPTGRAVHAFEASTQVAAAGQHYCMGASDFHSVEFHAGAHGWCIVEIEEIRRRSDRRADGLRAGMAYSRCEKVAHRSGLYALLEPNEREALFARVREGTGLDIK